MHELYAFIILKIHPAINFFIGLTHNKQYNKSIFYYTKEYGGRIS